MINTVLYFKSPCNSCSLSYVFSGATLRESSRRKYANSSECGRVRRVWGMKAGLKVRRPRLKVSLLSCQPGVCGEGRGMKTNEREILGCWSKAKSLTGPSPYPIVESLKKKEKVRERERDRVRMRKKVNWGGQWAGTGLVTTPRTQIQVLYH